MSIVLYISTAFTLLIFFHFFAATYGMSKSRQIKGDNLPWGISVIKPVKGIDADAYRNFKSFCEQSLSVPYQLIISLQDPHDPALPLLQDLQK